MRVLVTGADGFIGARVVRRLLENHHQVGVLTRGVSGWRRLRGLEHSVSPIKSALEDLDALGSELSRWRPEVCIHLAWYAEPGLYRTAPQNLACLQTSLQLLETLALVGCHHVVMVGTCAEYDTDAGYLKEDGPTRPTSLYAASKLALNVIAGARATQLGLGFTWARLFYLYGPGEDPRRLVPALIQALLRGEEFQAMSGTQVRDYLHVDDVAAALCAFAEQAVPGVFNVCSGEPITMAHLMGIVGDFLECKHLIRFGAIPDRDWEPPFICGDNRRLRRLGTWAPQHTLAEGLRATVRWWEARDRTSLAS